MPFGALVAGMRVHGALKFFAVFLPTGLDEAFQDIRLIGIGVFDIAGESLNSPVDGQKVITILGNQALAMRDLTAKPLEVIPYALRIADDDNSLIRIASDHFFRWREGITAAFGNPSVKKIVLRRGDWLGQFVLVHLSTVGI